jgi:Zn-dependent protease with chaperone function
MIFAFRSIVVALGFFGVLYCLLSLLVVILWRPVSLLCRTSVVDRARLLFALRIAPLLGSAFITLAFALPAFLLLEGGMDEDMGTLLFGVGTLLLLAAGSFRVMTALARATRMVAKWLEGAQPLNADAPAPTLQVRHGAPPLLLYGISAPRVLLSENAVAVLSPEELRVAVRHEIGHMRSRDNLKKLILHGSAFPGMGSLERAWQEAAEFAADEVSVSNASEALDLASALIKLSELVPVHYLPAFTTGLVDMTGLVDVRVRRLLAWNEISSRTARLRWWWLLTAIVATVPYTVAHYSHALLFTHQATEWFIH